LAVLLRTAVFWWLARPFGGLVAASCHFDCDFYMRIAAQGYGADPHFHDRGAYPNWAYFPLFPLLVRAVTLVAGSLPVAGILVSGVALAAFVGIGALYIRQTRSAPEVGFWLLLVCVAPYGVFLSIPYTEALFAALAIGVLWALAIRQPLVAAGFAAFASGCRPTGVLLVFLVIAAQAVSFWHSRGIRRTPLDWARILLPIAVAPLGLSLYMAWQYDQIGDGLAFSHVQAIWGRQWLGPVAWLRMGLRENDWREAYALFPAQSYAFNAAFALLGLVAAGWLALRRRWAEAWICGSMILLPLSTGLHSLPRFVGTNPAFLLASYDLLRPTRKLVRIGILLLLAAGEVTLLLAWYSRAEGLF
jgi:hypothetical protein